MSVKRRFLTWSVVALALVVGAAGGLALFGGTEGGARSAAAQASALARAPDGEPVAQVASELGPSAVQVNVEVSQDTPYGTEQGEGIGSGVVYREDGYIVTNNHVVEGASSVEVAFADGTSERGEVVAGDGFTDLAVVRVDRDGLPAASFAEGDLVAGQMAVAIGSPQGFESTVTSGVISGLSRELPAELTGGDTALVDLIQTDAAISPGSSGGALADRSGRVVGVNVAYVPPDAGAESLGFAIPSDTVVSVADQLIEDGEAVHPYLGISLADAASGGASSPAESGAVVTEVESGGPSEGAGVAPEDVVTAIGSVPVEDSGDLLGALRDYAPGENARLTLTREGEELTVDVPLGERNG